MRERSDVVSPTHTRVLILQRARHDFRALALLRFAIITIESSELAVVDAPIVLIRIRDPARVRRFILPRVVNSFHDLMA